MTDCLIIELFDYQGGIHWFRDDGSQQTLCGLRFDPVPSNTVVEGPVHSDLLCLGCMRAVLDLEKARAEARHE